MRRDLPLAAALVVVLAALTPAYTRVLPDGVWRAPVLLAAVLAVGLAAAVRALRGGGLLALAVSAVGLALFTYVTHLPGVGLLPDGSSWAAFTDLLGQAGLELREQRAPGVTVPGFTLALTTATWVVGHASHELLVRLRTPGAALVPPLVLWAMPLAIPLSEGGPPLARAVPFLLAAALVLLLGGDTEAPDDEPPRVTASGITVAGTALVAVVVAPLLLPAYDAGALLDLDASNDPRGYQPIVDISERLQLPEDRDVLTVRSNERTYLRLAGLDSFDGNVWRLGPSGETSYRPSDDSLFSASGTLPPEQPSGQTTSVRADITVLDLANIYVPAPYQPTAVGGPLRDEIVWSTEGGFLATWNVTEGGFEDARVGVTQGVSYRVEAERPTPDIEDLRALDVDPASVDRWTELPQPTGLGQIAEDVYADAGATTAVDQALALQSWFTSDGRFTYDLDVDPLRSGQDLLDFVTADREGYCEQFATAMAVMLRETGIPARVAVGFLPGEVQQVADPEAGREDAEYRVSTADAHAWVEVLFPGHGWVAFEPTPRDDGATFEPRPDDLFPDETVAEREERLEQEDPEDDPSEPEPAEPAEPTEPDPVPDEPDGSAGEDAAGSDDGRTWWPWLLLGLLGAGVAVAAVRSRPAGATDPSPTGQVLHAQRLLLRTATGLGLGRRASETVAEVVVRWRREGRLTGAEAERFASLSQAAAFGGSVAPADADDAERIAATLAEQLRASVGRGTRVTAPVRPRWEGLVARVRPLLDRLDDRRARR